METIKAEIQNVTCAFDPDAILYWEEQQEEPWVSENGRCSVSFVSASYCPPLNEKGEVARSFSLVTKGLFKTSPSFFKLKINGRNHTKIDTFNSIKIKTCSMSKLHTTQIKGKE